MAEYMIRFVKVYFNEDFFFSLVSWSLGLAFASLFLMENIRGDVYFYENNILVLWTETIICSSYAVWASVRLIKKLYAVVVQQEG